MFGKQGAKYKYLTHATKNEEFAKGIVENGLKYQEGRANISADLIHNLMYTADGGQREKEHKPGENKHIGQKEHREKEPDITHIIIFKKPENKIIHYGNQTILHEEDNLIKGHPRVRQGGRSQLSIYSDKATIGSLISNAKENYEKKITLSGIGEDSEYNYLDKTNLLLDYIPSERYQTIIKKLKKQIKRLGKIDSQKYIDEIKGELGKATHLQTGIDIEDIAKELFFSTIEQQVSRLVRTQYLLMKNYIGYRIATGKKDREINLFEPDPQKKRDQPTKEENINDFLSNIHLYHQKVNENNFDLIGDERLNRYIKLSINKIYQEYLSRDKSDFRV